MNFNGIEILSQFGQALVEDLRARTPKSIQDKITQEVTEKKLSIFGPYWIGVFEKGRGPTSPGAKRGSPTLQEAILIWISDKGITGRPNDAGKVPTDVQLSWAISNHIHKYGNKLYRDLAGGKTDYFDAVFSTDRIDAFLDTFANGYTSVIFSELVDTFKKN